MEVIAVVALLSKKAIEAKVITIQKIILNRGKLSRQEDKI